MESLIFQKGYWAKFHIYDNLGEGEPIDESMDDNEDVDPGLPNIFNEKLH